MCCQFNDIISWLCFNPCHSDCIKRFSVIQIIEDFTFLVFRNLIYNNNCKYRFRYFFLNHIWQFGKTFSVQFNFFIFICIWMIQSDRINTFEPKFIIHKFNNSETSLFSIEKRICFFMFWSVQRRNWFAKYERSDKARHSFNVPHVSSLNCIVINTNFVFVIWLHFWICPFNF